MIKKKILLFLLFFSYKNQYICKQIEEEYNTQFFSEIFLGKENIQERLTLKEEVVAGNEDINKKIADNITNYFSKLMSHNIGIEFSSKGININFSTKNFSFTYLHNNQNILNTSFKESKTKITLKTPSLKINNNLKIQGHFFVYQNKNLFEIYKKRLGVVLSIHNSTKSIFIPHQSFYFIFSQHTYKDNFFGIIIASLILELFKGIFLSFSGGLVLNEKSQKYDLKIIITFSKYIKFNIILVKKDIFSINNKWELSLDGSINCFSKDSQDKHLDNNLFKFYSDDSLFKIESHDEFLDSFVSKPTNEIIKFLTDLELNHITVHGKFSDDDSNLYNVLTTIQQAMNITNNNHQYTEMSNNFFIEIEQKITDFFSTVKSINEIETEIKDNIFYDSKKKKILILYTRLCNITKNFSDIFDNYEKQFINLTNPNSFHVQIIKYSKYILFKTIENSEQVIKAKDFYEKNKNIININYGESIGDEIEEKINNLIINNNKNIYNNITIENEDLKKKINKDISDNFTDVLNLQNIIQDSLDLLISTIIFFNKENDDNNNLIISKLKKIFNKSSIQLIPTKGSFEWQQSLNNYNQNKYFFSQQEVDKIKDNLISLDDQLQLKECGIDGENFIINNDLYIFFNNIIKEIKNILNEKSDNLEIKIKNIIKIIHMYSEWSSISYPIINDKNKFIILLQQTIKDCKEQLFHLTNTIYPQKIKKQDDLDNYFLVNNYEYPKDFFTIINENNVVQEINNLEENIKDKNQNENYIINPIEEQNPIEIRNFTEKIDQIFILLKKQLIDDPIDLQSIFLNTEEDILKSSIQLMINKNNENDEIFQWIEGVIYNQEKSLIGQDSYKILEITYKINEVLKTFGFEDNPINKRMKDIFQKIFTEENSKKNIDNNLLNIDNNLLFNKKSFADNFDEILKKFLDESKQDDKNNKDKKERLWNDRIYIYLIFFINYKFFNQNITNSKEITKNLFEIFLFEIFINMNDKIEDIVEKYKNIFLFNEDNEFVFQKNQYSTEYKTLNDLIIELKTDSNFQEIINHYIVNKEVQYIDLSQIDLLNNKTLKKNIKKIKKTSKDDFDIKPIVIKPIVIDKIKNIIHNIKNLKEKYPIPLLFLLDKKNNDNDLKKSLSQYIKTNEEKQDNKNELLKNPNNINNNKIFNLINEIYTEQLMNSKDHNDFLEFLYLKNQYKENEQEKKIDDIINFIPFNKVKNPLDSKEINGISIINHLVFANNLILYHNYSSIRDDKQYNQLYDKYTNLIKEETNFLNLTKNYKDYYQNQLMIYYLSYFYEKINRYDNYKFQVYNLLKILHIKYNNYDFNQNISYQNFLEKDKLNDVSLKLQIKIMISTIQKKQTKLLSNIENIMGYNDQYNDINNDLNNNDNNQLNDIYSIENAFDTFIKNKHKEIDQCKTFDDLQEIIKNIPNSLQNNDLQNNDLQNQIFNIINLKKIEYPKEITPNDLNDLNNLLDFDGLNEKEYEEYFDLIKKYIEKENLINDITMKIKTIDEEKRKNDTDINSLQDIEKSLNQVKTDSNQEKKTKNIGFFKKIFNKFKKKNLTQELDQNIETLDQTLEICLTKLMKFIQEKKNDTFYKEFLLTVNELINTKFKKNNEIKNFISEILELKNIITSEIKIIKNKNEKLEKNLNKEKTKKQLYESIINNIYVINKKNDFLITKIKQSKEIIKLIKKEKINSVKKNRLYHILINDYKKDFFWNFFYHEKENESPLIQKKKKMTQEEKAKKFIKNLIDPEEDNNDEQLIFNQIIMSKNKKQISSLEFPLYLLISTNYINPLDIDKKEKDFPLFIQYKTIECKDLSNINQFNFIGLPDIEEYSKYKYNYDNNKSSVDILFEEIIFNDLNTNNYVKFKSWKSEEQKENINIQTKCYLQESDNKIFNFSENHFIFKLEEIYFYDNEKIKEILKQLQDYLEKISDVKIYYNEKLYNNNTYTTLIEKITQSLEKESITNDDKQTQIKIKKDFIDLISNSKFSFYHGKLYNTFFVNENLTKKNKNFRVYFGHLDEKLMTIKKFINWGFVDPKHENIFIKIYKEAAKRDLSDVVDVVSKFFNTFTSLSDVDSPMFNRNNPINIIELENQSKIIKYMNKTLINIYDIDDNDDSNESVITTIKKYKEFNYYQSILDEKEAKISFHTMINQLIKDDNLMIVITGFLAKIEEFLDLIKNEMNCETLEKTILEQKTIIEEFLKNPLNYQNLFDSFKTITETINGYIDNYYYDEYKKQNYFYKIDTNITKNEYSILDIDNYINNFKLNYSLALNFLMLNSRNILNKNDINEAENKISSLVNNIIIKKNHKFIVNPFSFFIKNHQGLEIMLNMYKINKQNKNILSIIDYKDQILNFNNCFNTNDIMVHNNYDIHKINPTIYNKFTIQDKEIFNMPINQYNHQIKKVKTDRNFLSNILKGVSFNNNDPIFKKIIEDIYKKLQKKKEDVKIMELLKNTFQYIIEFHSTPVDINDKIFQIEKKRFHGDFQLYFELGHTLNKILDKKNLKTMPFYLFLKSEITKDSILYSVGSKIIIDKINDLILKSFYGVISFILMGIKDLSIISTYLNEETIKHILLINLLQKNAPILYEKLKNKDLNADLLKSILNDWDYLYEFTGCYFKLQSFIYICSSLLLLLENIKNNKKIFNSLNLDINSINGSIYSLKKMMKNAIKHNVKNSYIKQLKKRVLENSSSNVIEMI